MEQEKIGKFISALRKRHDTRAVGRKNESNRQIH